MGRKLGARNADVLIADSPEIQKYIVSTYGTTPAYIPYGAEVFSKPISRSHTNMPYGPSNIFFWSPEWNRRTTLK